MNISVIELQDRYKQSEIIHIIDVRNELEFHTYNIGGENIPLGKLMNVIDELDYNKNDELIVVCQHGIRSETARRILTDHGYLNVKNLSGGLVAWQRIKNK